MRIPVPIAILSCVIATGSVWYFGSRDADFTTPPSAEENQEAKEQWKKENAPAPAASITSTDTQVKKQAPKAPKLVKPKRVKPPKPKRLPTGDLGVSPQLSEYGILANEGAPSMVQLAQELESQQAWQHALLAWERVLDTTKASPEEASMAHKAITRLKPKQPAWNPDPLGDITITLHAGATIKNKQALESALKQTADSIAQASGYILKVTFQTSIGKGTPPDTPRVPIAIWFTRSDGKRQGETPPLSFMAAPDDVETLTKQCKLGVYNLLRAHLAETTAFSPLPEADPDTPAELRLNSHITRFMWREFANSLNSN
ncbi:hypothetical protein HW115_15970 [Verrucomicrobiaceae bacterium N1E253]|uniref:Uncharacterized protein n=1 Tax=Oceaniferula marina TaxID=2748318 RepID=A0A851GIW5_9BACT|nr:hypothetical protein [Oceaniferula marina]NWK57119.1 hypothetical protein [Oceaniferula marina]